MADKKAEFILKSETKALAESVMRNGAKHIGGRLLTAVSAMGEPNGAVLGEIVTALKSGALATGQEVLKERLQNRF